MKVRKVSFVFPNSFILVTGYILFLFHLSYRQTEGIIKVTGKRLLPSNSRSYGHICKRINGLYIDIKEGITHDDDKDIMISTDSTGIKVTNRDQLWMSEK